MTSSNGNHGEGGLTIAQISKQLDELLSTYMEKIEYYQTLQSKAAPFVKSGYLFIAKARINTVGFHMSPPSNMEPSVAVSCDFVGSDSNISTEDGHYTHRRVPYEKTKDLTVGNASEIVSSSSSTRKRRVLAEESDQQASEILSNSQNEDEESSNGSNGSGSRPSTPDSSKPKVIKDPFAAFSFMARNTLKPAQTNFSSALTFFIDAAETVQELKMLEKRYLTLKRLKAELESTPSLK